MQNKKEIIKKFGIIIVILIIIVYYFFIKKEDNYEEIVENSIVFSNIQEENTVQISKIKVYIIGEVNKPGVVELEEGARIEDAIILAGGTNSNSDLSKINLAYVLEDGQKIYVPSINETTENNYLISENFDGIEENNSEKNTKININTADLNKLCELPGVGESLANKIINYRQTNGKFKNIEDLKNVNGIGDKKYDNLKEYICIK